MSDFERQVNTSESTGNLAGGSWSTGFDRSESYELLAKAGEFIDRVDGLTGVVDKTHDNPIDAIPRDPTAKSNQFGLLGVDLSRVACQATVATIVDGQAVELHRGGQGFNPNTANAIWKGDELSLVALKRVIRNYDVWSDHNGSQTSSAGGWK